MELQTSFIFLLLLSFTAWSGSNATTEDDELSWKMKADIFAVFDPLEDKGVIEKEGEKTPFDDFDRHDSNVDALMPATSRRFRRKIIKLLRRAIRRLMRRPDGNLSPMKSNSSEYMH